MVKLKKKRLGPIRAQEGLRLEKFNGGHRGKGVVQEHLIFMIPVILSVLEKICAVSE